MSSHTLSSSAHTIVLITGSNTGIGLSTVQAFLSEPLDNLYTIILTSRSLERATDAAKGIEDSVKCKDVLSMGSKVVPMQLHVDDEESVHALRQDVGDRFGRVDVLIHNAGAYNRDISQDRRRFFHRI